MDDTSFLLLIDWQDEREFACVNSVERICMCEFCSFGPSSRRVDRDATNSDFAGFFSAAAIEAAVRLANENGGSEPSDDDTDGT